MRRAHHRVPGRARLPAPERGAGALSDNAPENRPTPLAALLEPETPATQHYRRNHFAYPRIQPGWHLEVRGAVARPLRLDMDALQSGPHRTLPAVLECAGHRRAELSPPVAGVPWGTGALSQVSWAGVPLAHVLGLAGVGASAVEVVLWGADRGVLPGQDGELPFARSLPLEKAMHPDTLLAWQMNDEPLPDVHGAPLRAIVPGWYAMDSVKWLTAIEVVDTPFRGYFQELDYRFLAPGEPGPGVRLAELPVHALIVEPAEGAACPAGRLAVRGICWGGQGEVAEVAVQVDGGAWQAARLGPAAGPYAWRLWELDADLVAGDHVLAVRARDGAGVSQPERPAWNVRGYANNSVYRVGIRLG